MKATFVEMPAFARLRPLYLDDEEYRRLQSTLMENPEAGDVIQGAGGLRKMRFADGRRNKGTRGELRVIYYRWEPGAQFWLYAVFDKDEGRTGRKELLMAKKSPAKPARKATKAAKPARNLYAELMEGMDALKRQRLGKCTLRTHVVEYRAAPEMTPSELVELRERLALSRPVFADYLRTNPRTLENWEQGRAKPNAQAALLISLVKRYPDTIERLASL